MTPENPLFAHFRHDFGPMYGNNQFVQLEVKRHPTGHYFYELEYDLPFVVGCEKSTIYSEDQTACFVRAAALLFHISRNHVSPAQLSLLRERLRPLMYEARQMKLKFDKAS